MRHVAWFAIVAAMILAGCIAPSPSFARHGFKASLIGCPNGIADVLDGCAGSNPASSIQYANFFTSVAPQSGQTYFSANPNSNWNAPGIQYPIGPYTPRALANDPQAPGNHPSTCALTSFTSPNYGVLTCSGSTPAYTWHNLDFGPINGHGPTFVYFHTTTGLQTFDDVWFTESSDCPSPSQTVNTWIYAAVGQTTAYTLQYFSYDGASAQCKPSIALGDTALIPIAFFTSGNVLVQYGMFANVTGSRFLSINCSNTSIVCAVRFVMLHNWAPHPAGGHGELDAISPNTGQTPNVSMDHIVAWNDVGVSASTSTTLAYLSNGASGTFGTLTLDHAVLISNTITGGSATKNATISYTIGNSPSGGLGTGAGYYLTVTGLSAGAIVATGEVIGSIGGNGGAWGIDANVSGGTGVGSVWQVNCASPYTNCTTANNQGQYSSVWMANYQGTFTNQSLTDNTVGPCAEAAHNGYGQIVITNNLCDLTGGGPGPWEALTNAGCTVAADILGNRDLLTGNSINSWTAVAGGC